MTREDKIARARESVTQILASGAANADELLAKSLGEFADDIASDAGDEAAPFDEDLAKSAAEVGQVARFAAALESLCGVVEMLQKGEYYAIGISGRRPEPVSSEIANLLDRLCDHGDLVLRAMVNERSTLADGPEVEKADLPTVAVPPAEGEGEPVLLKVALGDDEAEFAELATDPAMLRQGFAELGSEMLVLAGADPDALQKFQPPAPGDQGEMPAGAEAEEGAEEPEINPLQTLGKLAASMMLIVDAMERSQGGGEEDGAEEGAAPPVAEKPAPVPQGDQPPPAEAGDGNEQEQQDDQQKKGFRAMKADRTLRLAKRDPDPTFVGQIEDETGEAFNVTADGLVVDDAGEVMGLLAEGDGEDDMVVLPPTDEVLAEAGFDFAEDAETGETLIVLAEDAEDDEGEGAAGDGQPDEVDVAAAQIVDNLADKAAPRGDMAKGASTDPAVMQVLTAMASTVAAIGARMEKIEARPALPAPKGVVRAVAKADDSGPVIDARPDEVEVLRKSSAAPEQIAAAMIKAAHRTGGSPFRG
jgi:hypothetical protein